MKKTKYVFLICITLIVVGLSFIVPPILLKYQDTMMENSVEKFDTELVDINEITELTLLEKLELAINHTSSFAVDAGSNIINSEQAIAQARQQLEELFIIIQEVSGGVNIDYSGIETEGEATANASLVLNGDTNRSMNVWEVTLTLPDVYYVVMLDDQTGKILHLALGERSHDGIAYGEVPYEPDIDELRLIAFAYSEYLGLVVEDITNLNERTVVTCYTENSNNYFVKFDSWSVVPLGINVQ